MNSNDYDFFCDLENAKTMDYDHVDYYVVKVKTRYEVRRVQIITGEPKPVVLFGEPKPIALGEHKPIAIGEHKPIAIGDEPDPDKKLGLLECLARLPSDIYYSFMVCTVTASCVYLVMTI